MLAIRLKKKKLKNDKEKNTTNRGKDTATNISNIISNIIAIYCI